jgi:hypothetical protein
MAALILVEEVCIHHSPLVEPEREVKQIMTV